MSDTYSIEVIEKAMWKHCDSMNPVDDTLAELTKTEWKPAIGQYYLNDTGGAYKSDHEHRVFGANIRHFTTKEAGPECMQHLVDALESISDMNKSHWWCLEAINALAKHKELMK